MLTWLADLFGPLITYLGIPVTQRYVIDFEGSGVSVADNPGKRCTTITISNSGITTDVNPTDNTVPVRDSTGQLRATSFEATNPSSFFAAATSGALRLLPGAQVAIALHGIVSDSVQIIGTESASVGCFGDANEILSWDFQQTSVFGVTSLEMSPDGRLSPYTLSIAAPVATTGATPTTIATIPIAAGTTVTVRARVFAILASGGLNANMAPTVYNEIEVIGFRTPAGLGASSPTAQSAATAPFCVFGNASQGSLGFGVSGNNLILQVEGFAVAEAWTVSHTYTTGDGNTTPGQFVTNAGNVYVCITSGTALTAPTGTSTSTGTGAVFAYVGAGSNVPVTWQLSELEISQGQ